LSKITAGNFDWFLHTILFVHSQRIIQQLIDRERNNLAEYQMNHEENEGEGEEEEEEEVEKEGY
jgi:hypothetical protein